MKHSLRLLRVLAAPARLAIMTELAGQPRCVHELVDRLAMSQPLVSQHPRVLRAARLVGVERQGREAVYSLADRHVPGSSPMPSGTAATRRSTRAAVRVETATRQGENARSTMSDQQTAGDMHGEVERRLRRFDQRYTAGRRAIVDLLVSAGHPVTIGDIAERLPGLPRSSAYRHLVDLHAAGLVRRVTAHDEYTRFELAEDLTEHHHHLLCVNCGKAIDVTLPAGFEEQASAAIGQLASAENFEPHSHSIDVFGLCAACR